VIKKHIGTIFFAALGLGLLAKGPLIMVLTFPPLLSGVA
jgi:4-amino-4-deoxy-L-arabinose transferase-like glycosyltransferase